VSPSAVFGYEYAITTHDPVQFDAAAGRHRGHIPNSDNIRHHVYSFSPAKKFELPLYSGVPAEPVVFDKVGFVTLGCNIHDWMIAFVAVLPTPYFQATGKDGRATLKICRRGNTPCKRRTRR
jgi:hypothetical protein